MVRKAADKSITEKSTLIKLDNPKALANFANDLKDFVVKNKLYTEMVSKKKVGDKYVEEKKNYVNVEGWQFAGASMGIFPQVVSEERIAEDGKVEYQSYGKKETAPIYKYKVTVELVQITTGKIVGRAFAICSNQESKKKTFDEFAVASMAQTRATAKAFRLALGWIMKLAGYEATPTEEVGGDNTDDSSNEPQEGVVVEMPIEEVRVIVDAHLNHLDAASKVKFLKDHANALNDKKLDDRQYRNLLEGVRQARIAQQEQTAPPEK